MPPWLIPLGIGAGAAALAWGFLRTVLPSSTPVIIWQTGASESAEFRRVATVVANVLPGARVSSASSLAGISAALSQVNGAIGPLVLIGHGSTTAFFSGAVRPENLAQLIGRRLAPGAIVGLAGCRAGGDPGSADWEAAAFGPGGAQSFAGRLRDALVIAGAPWGVKVRAHSTTGHASANPAIREFPVSRGALGQAGESGLDSVLGSGAWRSDDLRRRWTAAVRGDLSSLWIAGYSLPRSI